jgi:hypothetical protein
LQGISAPALTGPGFGRSHLNASQLRIVVTQTIPLTAPGSLKPDEYAAVMAFLLSYDCVQSDGDGQQFVGKIESDGRQLNLLELRIRRFIGCGDSRIS